MTPPLRDLPRDRRPRIAIIDDYMRVATRLADWSPVEARADVTVFDRAFGSTEEAAAALAGFDAISTMRERTALPRELLEALPDLRAVVITGRRHRLLDVEAAAELGIAVMRCDGSGGNTTVELAWGLILALLRDLPGQIAQMAPGGGWQTRLGHGLEGRVLGLVGLGRLGARMVPVARAFGMDVIAWSQNLTEERAAELGVRRVGKAELFSQADIVSVHLVLSPRSEGIVGAAEIGAMKPGAVLVNTSRGPLVDTGALSAALTEGRIAGAALDVFDHEPLPADDPLRGVPNLILTPHLGYVVEETFRPFYMRTVSNLLGWLDGSPPNLVLPGD